MKPYVGPLATALGHLQQATMWFMQNAIGQARQRRRGRDRLHAPLRAAWRSATCGAGSSRRRTPKLAGADGDAARMEAKLVTGRFFMERMLPETAAHLARIQSGAASTMALPAEAF